MRIRYIEAPTDYCGDEPNKVFLAGGITGCLNWQSELCERLDAFPDACCTVLNPRRMAFVASDASARQQIEWEFIHLRRANAISFWFPADSICPIALFELGKWLVYGKEPLKPLFIGMDPLYQRRLDVETQVKLERPGLKLYFSLAELAGHIHHWSLAVKS